MKQEQYDIAIQEAWRKYRNDDTLVIMASENFKAGFMAGADWRINSVWNDVDKEPKQGAWFLAQIGDGCFDIFVMEVESERWRRWCKGMDVMRWAYITDLLPEGGAQ